jgi:activator of HSP90 ATPase
MKNSFTISAILHADAERIYKAWLSSEEHAAFTGSSAHVTPEVNGKFTAWDGYISGKTIAMEPFHRIVQTWRTTEFPADAPDSHLEILIEKVKEGTRITLIHSEIPAGQADEYKRGWKDFYFKPMHTYFSSE